jgi:hypothetical protein
MLDVFEYWVRLRNKNCTEVSILSHYVFYGNNCGCQNTDCKILTFLGAFAKLRKVTINFVMCARLSVLMEHLASHWTDFREIWYLIIFRKSVEKIQLSLKSDKNNGYFTWRLIYIFDHISLISFRMRNFSEKSCCQNQNTHNLCPLIFFSRKSWHLWDNVEHTVEPSRPQMTIWRMRIVFWIPKATDTH